MYLKVVEKEMIRMLPKGSMINVKKGLGIALLVIVGGSLLNIGQINALATPMIKNIIMLGAGYLLLIAGRQK